MEDATINVCLDMQPTVVILFFLLPPFPLGEKLRTCLGLTRELEDIVGRQAHRHTHAIISSGPSKCCWPVRSSPLVNLARAAGMLCGARAGSTILLCRYVPYPLCSVHKDAAGKLPR